MKGDSSEMKFRRHPSEKGERRHAERQDEHSMRVAADHSHRAEQKKMSSKDPRELEKKSQNELRREKEYHKPTRKDKNRHISPLLARRDGVHRNSPVELVVKGCRNTDSSSSDSESSHSDHGNYSNRRHKRKHREDSYEELSRKKKQIESELSALLAEEAENDRIQDGRKKSRNQASRERRVDRPIKQERISDDERGSRNNRRSSPKRSEEKMEWGKKSSSDTKKGVKDKEKPNFAVSGKLAEDTNTYNGVVIKYNEPKEARKPKRRWRLYPFKGEASLDFIPIHRQSAYLLGRSRLIADIPIDHPSCSKQHAVLQYRLVDYRREDGTVGKRLRPYIIDLESSNGTFVNNNKIEPRRYVELLEKDIIKFGFSTREYVILHDQSKDESLVDDDDVIEENV